MTNDLDIIIPIAIDLDWPTKETIIEVIREQHERFGFTRFALAGPGGGWRSFGYPTKECFESIADLFIQVRDALALEGVDCGWWITTTVKSGHSRDFSPVIKGDGSVHPFANCPLDPGFRKRFAEDVAAFSAKAHPSFIFTEDDYSLAAASGCFCERHIREFSRRTGREYTREEIVARLNQYTPDDTSFERAWREMKNDTLVELSKAIRRELDILTPEIPMGYMQSGGADWDGDCTEAISRAMAGSRHTPFCRFYGAAYSGTDVKRIPEILYHPIFNRQHISPPFKYIHESDTFPHNRFYMAGVEMAAMMASVYSQGFDGSTFQTQQLLDDPNEEKTYGDTFSAERARFNAARRIASKCERVGVEIDYDPFWNTYDKTQSTSEPLWTGAVSRFGIPYVTTDAPIAFWDGRQGAHASDEEVRSRLSRGVFLDGDTAFALCRRGYGKYLGVEVTDVNASAGDVQWDLGAREVIRDGFGGKGRNMPSAHMYSPPGNGILRVMHVTDDRTEVVSDAYTFRREYVCPAMTRFENELGGRVVVMGMTLNHNRSQALYNYRRRKLIHDMMLWMGDEPSFAENGDVVYVIENRAVDPLPDEPIGMLTLINLSPDPRRDLHLHLRESFRNCKYCYITEDGTLAPLATLPASDGIILVNPLEYLKPMFLVIQ